jgi:hypothetical protein
MAGMRNTYKTLVGRSEKKNTRETEKCMEGDNIIKMFRKQIWFNRLWRGISGGFL